MVDAGLAADVSSLPLPPTNPMPYGQRVRAMRSFHTGMGKLRDAGGPVTWFTLGPSWLVPPVVAVTSPAAIRDVLTRKDGVVEKANSLYVELRRLIGANLFDLPHEPWLPRRRALQPVFTKQHVRQFGGHMAQAAESVASRWDDAAEIDLDIECRKLTMRALGRSVLGLDLDRRADTLSEPLRTALQYVTGRVIRPLHAPHWLPTPSRRRAREATATMKQLADDILQACRVDPTIDAPLVDALINATDPVTGRSLSDSEVQDEMLVFLGAGHDTTATALTYALWALGHHHRLQDRVYVEVAELGDRELTPENMPRLSFTVQVLHEALRLCPPAPAVSRMAMQDIQVDGYRVKAGTLLLIGIGAVHTDPKLWDNPLVFDPDRFSTTNSKGRDRWEYLPFGAGPRSCIGDHFAMLEATLALATCIRRVEIRSLHDDFPLALPFTLVAGGPIRARVLVRN